MNNQQKYIGIGIAGALAVVVALKMFSEIGQDSNYQLAIIAGIVGTMLYLVFSIFVTTQVLVPARQAAVTLPKNKKQ